MQERTPRCEYSFSATFAAMHETCIHVRTGIRVKVLTFRRSSSALLAEGARHGLLASVLYLNDTVNLPLRCLDEALRRVYACAYVRCIHFVTYHTHTHTHKHTHECVVMHRKVRKIRACPYHTHTHAYFHIYTNTQNTFHIWTHTHTHT
jgi:hypothetical protein